MSVCSCWHHHHRLFDSTVSSFGMGQSAIDVSLLGQVLDCDACSNLQHESMLLRSKDRSSEDRCRPRVLDSDCNNRESTVKQLGTAGSKRDKANTSTTTTDKRTEMFAAELDLDTNTGSTKQDRNIRHRTLHRSYQHIFQNLKFKTDFHFKKFEYFKYKISNLWD